jgi:hypothetical protein
MRKHYDFTNARPNPYAKRLKKPVTIRLDEATISYFKALAEETELPYQSLINLYLRDCAAQERRLDLSQDVFGGSPPARVQPMELQAPFQLRLEFGVQRLFPRLETVPKILGELNPLLRGQMGKVKDGRSHGSNLVSGRGERKQSRLRSNDRQISCKRPEKTSIP